MAGGVAVQANLLCVTWSAAQGHVFLFDLEAARRVSAWTLPGSPQGYSDAAGVAMNEHFQLFVADPHNQCVRHFSVFGRHLGDLGTAAPPTGDAARDRPGVLDRPHGVAVHAGTVVVACGDQPRRRGVQRFGPGGLLLRPLASGGDADAAFQAPRGVWADADGVLVAETLAGRIQRFRPDGTFVAHLPVGAGGARGRPVGVVRLPSGVVLVADRGDEPGVHALRPDGVRLPAAATAALRERCEQALALTRDAQGNVYVLDRGGERVQRFGRDLRFDRVVVDLAEHQDDYQPGIP